MITNEDNDNCAMLEFKCTKTKYQYCQYCLEDKKGKCINDMKGYCFSNAAQRDTLIEILYADTTDLLEIEKENHKKTYRKDNYELEC